MNPWINNIPWLAIDHNPEPCQGIRVEIQIGHAPCVLAQPLPPWNGSLQVSWHHGMGVVARETCRASGRGTHHGTCPSTASSTISRVIVAVVAREVARVACLGLARGHQARPRGTCRVSWLGSRASTMQGLVPPWLGSRGTKQGPVAPWLGSREGTMQGPVPPWLGSRAPSKAPWHASRVLAWLAGGHHARPRATLAWLAGGHQARPRATLAWLAGGHHARPRATLAWLAGTK